MKRGVRPSYTLMFDGGSRGNPGSMYGSFRIRTSAGSEVLRSRLTFGRGTNNEAEYRALIAALEALLAELERSGQDPGQVRLEVRGDSLLVLGQLAGAWKAREPRMLSLRNQARELLSRFGQVRLRHQDRALSVAVLGH